MPIFELLAVFLQQLRTAHRLTSEYKTFCAALVVAFVGVEGAPFVAATSTSLDVEGLPAEVPLVAMTPAMGFC